MKLFSSTLQFPKYISNIFSYMVLSQSHKSTLELSQLRIESSHSLFSDTTE